jgi:hypothetical protein
MSGSGNNPDPDDPLVREEIRSAVKRARDSAFGSYMSEQDLARSAEGHLIDTYGTSAISAQFTDAVHHEVRRQTEISARFRGAEILISHAPENTPGSSDSASANNADGYGAAAHLQHAPGADPVAGMVVDHWFGDAEMLSLRGTSRFSQSLLQRSYDPSAPRDFYRGYAVGLVALVQMVAPNDTLLHYRGAIDQVDEIITRTWTGTQDQIGGVTFATANAYQYSTGDGTVRELVEALRIEIAVIAECFYLAMQHGL